MEVEIETIEDEALNPDPYDFVYSNIPTSTNVLQKEEDCRFCHATKFKYETEGLCCRKGQIRLANPKTPPELMRLWTSNDSDARHFRQNIRFSMGTSHLLPYTATSTEKQLTCEQLVFTPFEHMVKYIIT